MATLTGFTRGLDPIIAADLAAKIQTDIGATIDYVEITPSNISVTGTISESDRTSIQTSISAYVYIAPALPAVTGLKKQGASNFMKGNVTLVPGTNMSIQQSGNNITLSSSNTSITQAEVDFGFPNGDEADSAIVTVLADWAASTSTLIAQPALIATTDHDPDDVYAEGIVAYTENIVAGVSFDVVARAPNNSWGKYKINIVGA